LASVKKLQYIRVLLKRATHRKMPYLILCEALSMAWLYLNSGGFLIVNWWFFALGIGSLILLAILERRTRLPFPFMNDVDGTGLFAVFGMALGATFVISLVMPQLYQHMHIEPLVFFSFPNIVSGMIAGITEESFKVALTNAAILSLRKISVAGKSKILDKAILYIVGTVSVAFWAWLHIQLRSSSVGFGVTAFIVGMVYFGLVLMCKNYLPTVLAHAVYDWIPVVF
jgi:hypothetical protein